MSKPASDDLDRTSGRFVRNLALSLSGGALLTLVGASAAHAQDASTAGTDSSGLGATGTGDATSVGNHSGSNTTQGGTISGAQGSVQVITQTGGVNNNGVAVANTGRNTATGNSSNNTADLGAQEGEGGAGGAVNNGQAANGSDGVAFITTGNASAIGNQSTTNLNQTISARGALGGILVLTQDSTVTNSGRAFAGTGHNTATGNSSFNEADLGQGFLLDNGLGSNSGKATTSSDGRATIATGSASAMGNVSDTSVTQSSNGAAGGDGMGGGLVVIPQTADVENDGRAAATTGDNTAIGNEDQENSATMGQNIGLTGAPFFQTGLGVASNQGEASTSSDGSASVATGAASAVGNQSSSNVGLWAMSDLTHDGGLTLLPQLSVVDNTGRARANTGGNMAIGANMEADTLNLNQDQPSAQVDGIPFAAGFVNSGVVSNAGEASTSSDGSASITTGAASAVGNRSRTATSQSSSANDNNLNIYPQAAFVSNTGIAFAGTGDNTATGNDSESSGTLQQFTELPTTGLDRAVTSNAGHLASSSDGAASIATGSATALGNDSTTAVTQEIDPVGLVLPVQTAAVVNAGAGVALTGDDTADGNHSLTFTSFDQVAEAYASTPPPTINVGLTIAANQADMSNASDGSATVVTGAASATGNESDTTIDQSSTGTVEGLGLIVNTQAAVVLNAGAGVATTGGNDATGNEAANTLQSPLSTNGGNLQASGIGEEGTGIAGSSINTGIATISDTATATDSSNGRASIVTGSASADGNRSTTNLHQEEEGAISGVGAVIDTQAAAVANLGLAVASTGGNTATGNESHSSASLTQGASVGGDDLANALTTVTAPSITSANSGSVSNASDGTAGIVTGSARALGNASSTDVTQDPSSSVSGLGLVVDTQAAVVANVGVGIANSGGNTATGNASTNANNGNLSAATALQLAAVGDENGTGSTTTLDARGPIVASNVAQVGNASDGTANVRTGAASAEGNVSTTTIDQSEDGSVSGLGAVVDTQVAGVANVGIGVANSGVNEAIGNESNNSGTTPVDGKTAGAFVQQVAGIGSFNTTKGAPGSVDLTGLGPMVASNAGTATNSSDGTAQVGTGAATASGNHSATTISQHQSGSVTELGIDVSTQAAGVANIGIGIANSGANEAIGNASGEISPTGGTAVPNQATADQRALFITLAGAPDPPPTSPVTVLGPTTASNEGDVGESTDGHACVCTGNATASGNISSTTLTQDLDTSVGTGAIVLTEAGGVLNAGVGIANSGLNLAEGNISQNMATATQIDTINAGLATAPGGIVGPQTVNTGGGATNTADGTGKVGTGNAMATGNESTTGQAQAASVQSDLAVATIAGGTSNTGLGLANSGVNEGVGNASVNDARLTQTADGAGIVSSVGTASNESDGSGLVGNPNCNVPGAPTTTPGTPGAATLPHTGAPIEVEAAIGLMLLLAGFGLRRKSHQLA